LVLRAPLAWTAGVSSVAPFALATTTCSVSPDWAGAFACNKLRALVESVFGNAKEVVYRDPAA
jgi:hypothetical protein